MSELPVDDADASSSSLLHQRMEAKAGSSNDEDVCVICLSAVTERAIADPCNHCAFDFICLVSWLQQRPACPLCKANVTAVQYDWRSPTDFRQYIVPRPKIAVPLSRASHSLPRRPASSRRPYVRPQRDIAVLRRQHVYRHKLYSFYIGSNPLSGYREVTPDMVTASPELQSKARTWIRRELRVFTFLHTDPDSGPSEGATTSSNAEFLLSYIVAILKKVDLKASDGHAEDLLTDYLGRENARLFLHELNAWLRSPFTKVADWDREVQYSEELPGQASGTGSETCS